uniref:Uncharacterized protein n=1 Tax=Nothobranchius kadleci TaxID=1051664 RepID=A0A1A8D3Y5_NOTKA
MRNRSFSKSETNQEFAKTWSNPNFKVSKMSISSNTESPGFRSSPKTALESDLGSPMMLYETRSLKLSPSSEHQTSNLRSDAEQKTSLSPKVLPKNPTTIKTTFNDGPKADPTIPSQTLDLSEQPYTVIMKSSPLLNMAALPTGTSHFKASKDDFTLKDNKLLEDNSVRKQHGYLKMNPVTEPPAGSILLSQASRGDPESSRQHNPEVATEQNITSTQVLNKHLSLRTTVLKTLKVSDKENQDDLAPLSGFRKSKTNPFNNQTLKVSGNSTYKQKDTDESSAKSFKVPLQTGSFEDQIFQ